MNTVEILDQLVRFDTVSHHSNLKMVSFICSFLGSHGILTRIVPDAAGQKASIFATVGPHGEPGIILSGHMDVVSVEGQTWRTDPFVLEEQEGRLYGRGTTDMKGFLASAMNAAVQASQKRLTTPLHLAFSYDEEIGCVGVRPLLEDLKSAIPVPRCCLIGEPTSMAVAIGHKGKVAAKLICRGTTAHSAYAPHALNALHLAADALNVLRSIQKHIESNGERDLSYEIPYSTIHAGLMGGGTAVNIVPDEASIEFEIRTIGNDSAAILQDIEKKLEAIVAPLRKTFPTAAIELEIGNEYPGLSTSASSSAASFVASLFSGPPVKKVAFGTEAGLFQRTLCPDVVVCGPGSMEQGHRADEYIERSQLAACDQMLENLVERLV